MTWAIEALVFLLTGLQAHAVVVGLARDGLHRALLAALLVTLTIVVERELDLEEARVRHALASTSR